MNVQNEMKLVFPAKSCNEGLARAAAFSFASQLDPSINEITEIKTAVSEAVTNCIVHAYKETPGNIELVARIYGDNGIYIRIKDKGCGIPDIKKAMEPLYTTAPEEERAGLGFAVMESFMDRVTVRSAVNKGTSVTMRKKISSVMK